jgi:hypothetical protein
MSLRQFLYNHNITITLTDCWHVPLCYKHYQYLMEPTLRDRSFTYSDYEHINCVRLYLQVATLSDISDGNGQTANRPSRLVNDQTTANLLEPGLDNQQ